MLYSLKISHVYSMLILLVVMLGISEAFVIDDPGLHEHLGGPEHEHEHGKIKYITKYLQLLLLSLKKTN